MNTESAIYLGVAGLVMVVAAFLLGRRTSSNSTRVLELEAELTLAKSEQSRSEAEAERLRNDLDAQRQEYDEYRLNVVDHFSGTSDLLRDLTVQYRSVYEHLTAGASKLCPEGFVGLTDGLPVPQLDGARPDLEDPDDRLAADPAVAEGSDEGDEIEEPASPDDRPRAVVGSSDAAGSEDSESADGDAEPTLAAAAADSDDDELDPEETLQVPAAPV